MTWYVLMWFTFSFITHTNPSASLSHSGSSDSLSRSAPPAKPAVKTGAFLLWKLKCVCSILVQRSSHTYVYIVYVYLYLQYLGCIGIMTMGTRTTRVPASDLINVRSLPKPHWNPHAQPSPKRRCSPLQCNPTCRINRLRTNKILKACN